MNTNQSPQQLAELLARKCADNMIESGILLPPLSGNKPQSTIDLILQSIPLVELLELVKTADSSPCRHNVSFTGKDCITCNALNVVKTKLTQILEGETKK